MNRNRVHNGYHSALVEQVRKYASAPRKTDSLRTKAMVGELSLASADLVSALADDAAPADPQLYRHLDRPPRPLG
jgi:hypothetical protein